MDIRGIHSKGCGSDQDNIHPIPLVYHVLLPTHRLTPVFNDPGFSNRVAFLIFEITALHNFALYAFCVMPNHVHILCKPGQVMVSHLANMIRFTSEFFLIKAGHTDAVWSPDHVEQPLRTNDEVLATAVHIFENPIRSGLCENAATYQYSYVLNYKDYVP